MTVPAQDVRRLEKGRRKSCIFTAIDRDRRTVSARGSALTLSEDGLCSQFVPVDVSPCATAKEDASASDVFWAPESSQRDSRDKYVTVPQVRSSMLVYWAKSFRLFFLYPNAFKLAFVTVHDPFSADRRSPRGARCRLTLGLETS
jgi:hypothetical protein